MEFLTSFYRSIFDLDWLGAQRHEKAQAWSYAFLFLFIVTIGQFISLMWFVPKFINTVSSSISTTVPDFQATFANEKLSVNGLEQPYIRDVTLDSTNESALRIVVDTVSTTTPTVDMYRAANLPVVLITADGFSNLDIRTGRIQTQTWQGMTTTTTITRTDVVGIVDKFAGTIGYFIAPIFIVLAYLGTLIWTFIYLALVAFMIWFGSVVGKRTWSYRQIYTVGLFAMTAPVLIDLALRAIGISIPFVHTIILACLIIFAMRRDGQIIAADSSLQKK